MRGVDADRGSSKGDWLSGLVCFEVDRHERGPGLIETGVLGGRRRHDIGSLPIGGSNNVARGAVEADDDNWRSDLARGEVDWDQTRGVSDVGHRWRQVLQ